MIFLLIMILILFAFPMFYLYRRSILDQELEHQRVQDILAGKYRKEDLSRILILTVKRAVPSLIAADILGVQPVTGPVGLIHPLKVRNATAPTMPMSKAEDEETKY